MSALSRRDLIKVGAFGTAALMLPLERVARAQLALSNRMPSSQLPAPYTIPFRQPVVAVPAYQTASTDYYRMTMQQVNLEVLPGFRTDMWGYDGQIPGPTIMNQQGRPCVVQHINGLPDAHPTERYVPWTSVHLHGSCSRPQYDGYASDITFPGEWKNYHYPNIQDARTLWYHDHGVHHTAPNVFMGLAGQYHLHSPEELALPIPHDGYDVPLIIRDALFQANGQLLFNDNDEAGAYGDVILVNGVPWPRMPVERRKYRFRILNGSTARSFNYRLSTGEPLTVIATDGGLMPAPQQTGNVRHGVAERYEVVIDFAQYKIGQRVELLNTSPPNNIDWEGIQRIMAFDVVGDAQDSRNNDIPSELNTNDRCMSLTPGDCSVKRNMRFRREGGQWTIDGHTWDDVINSDYQFVLANPKFEAAEEWTLENRGGGWHHPVHIHLIDFKCFARTKNGKLVDVPPWERGPKDVIFLGENESVTLLAHFDNQTGRYMMHCHNLSHECHDMMGQFRVGEDEEGFLGNDPILADPARGGPPQPLSEIVHIDHEGDSSGPGPGIVNDLVDNSGPGSNNSGPGSSNSGPGPGVVRRPVSPAAVAKKKRLIRELAENKKKKAAKRCVTPKQKKRKPARPVTKVCKPKRKIKARAPKRTNVKTLKRRS